MATEVRIIGLDGIPEVHPGDDQVKVQVWISLNLPKDR